MHDGRHDVDDGGWIIRPAEDSTLTILLLTMASADSERQPLVEAASLRDAVASRAPLDDDDGDDDDDDAAAAVASSSSSRRLPVRVVMGMLMCSAWIVAYSDRTNISLAIIEMEEEYGWDHAVDGVVLSSFFWG